MRPLRTPHWCPRSGPPSGTDAGCQFLATMFRGEFKRFQSPDLSDIQFADKPIWWLQLVNHQSCDIG